MLSRLEPRYNPYDEGYPPCIGCDQETLLRHPILLLPMCSICQDALADHLRCRECGTATGLTSCRACTCDAPLDRVWKSEAKSQREVA